MVFGEVMTKVLSSIKLPVATQANVETGYSGAGLIYYDSVNAVIRVHNGTSWSSLGGSSSVDMPIGSIQPWLGATTPSGWLICNGQAVSRTTYATLFAIISESFGVGDGTTTFELPQLRGRQLTGAPSTGYPISAEVNVGGNSSASTVASHVAAYGDHSHSLTYTAYAEPEHDYTHTHSATATDGTNTPIAHTLSGTSYGGGTHSHTSTVGTGASGSFTTGSSTFSSSGHSHTGPTTSTDYHSHTYSTSSWSAHAAHRHSPVFLLETSASTASATPASHNHTATPGTGGSHAHTDHSYKTYMVYYIIKAV